MSKVDNQYQERLDAAAKLFKIVKLNVHPRTVERYVDVLEEISERKQRGVKQILSSSGGVFSEKYSGVVVETNIPIFSWCEHHILPWFGQANIGYLADNKVLGLSKFTRIVDYFSRGMTIQERVTNHIAEFLESELSGDVIVMIEAIHTCKVARGIQSPFSRSVTLDARGLFRTNESLKSEFLSVVQLAHR